MNFKGLEGMTIKAGYVLSCKTERGERSPLEIKDKKKRYECGLDEGKGGITDNKNQPLA